MPRLGWSPAALVLGWLMLVCPAGAQTPGTQPEPALPTLHLYANLVQVPVLVLDPHLRPLPLIPFNLFEVVVDSGKPFTPTRVRREGDDPISLSILLDLSGAEGQVMRKLPQVVEAWAAGSLKPQDRVSIYGMDCALVRTGSTLPGDHVEDIGTAVRLAIDSKSVHGSRDNPACWGSKRVWDSLDLVAAQQANQPPPCDSGDDGRA